MPCSSASARHFLANSFASGLSSSSEKGVMFSDTHTCRNSAAGVVIVGSLLVRQLNALEGAVIHDYFFGPATAIRSLPAKSHSKPLRLRGAKAGLRPSRQPVDRLWGTSAPLGHRRELDSWR